MDDRDTLKSFLKDYCEYHLSHAPNYTERQPVYICPFCGSGSGNNHHSGTAATGAFSITPDGKHYHCFACGESGDIFDLIGKCENIDGAGSMIKRAREIYSLPAPVNNKKDPAKVPQKKNAPTPAPDPQEQKTDYLNFFLSANEHIKETDYHRGITLETLNRFKIGYVKDWKHPKAPDKSPATPRLIVPTSRVSYLARDTRADLTEEQQKYKKMKVGRVHIFNINTLTKAAGAVFIVEGEIDALSIIDVGGDAVGLGSLTMINSFLDFTKQHKPAVPFIIALDNDAAGKAQREKLEKGLIEQGIFFIEQDITGTYKDANEALMADRDTFTAAVNLARTKAETAAEKAKEEQQAEKLKEVSALSGAARLAGIIQTQDSIEVIAGTGLTGLDRALDGGFYGGLYIFGAVSSLGKTTFILQAADAIAAQGKTVLYISLEMDARELIGKSVSREMFKACRAAGKGSRQAKTARAILSRKRRSNFSVEEKELLEQGINNYKQTAGNMFIIEGVGSIGVQQIREDVAKIKDATGTAPVVIIDYLQILAPYDENYIHCTDKQNTDKSVLELKRLSRDFQTAVIAISSFNRDNYSQPVSMAAFKESGAIEYGSDVLLAMQPQGVKEASTKQEIKDNIQIIKNCKKAREKDLEIVVLKNRFGSTGDVYPVKYYALFNLFEEQENKFVPDTDSDNPFTRDDGNQKKENANPQYVQEKLF